MQFCNGWLLSYGWLAGVRSTVIRDKCQPWLGICTVSILVQVTLPRIPMQHHAMWPVIHEGLRSDQEGTGSQAIMANLCGVWKTTQPEKVPIMLSLSPYLYVAVLLFTCCCRGLYFLLIELLNHGRVGPKWRTDQVFIKTFVRLILILHFTDTKTKHLRWESLDWKLGLRNKINWVSNTGVQSKFILSSLLRCDQMSTMVK